MMLSDDVRGPQPVSPDVSAFLCQHIANNMSKINMKPITLPYILVSRRTSTLELKEAEMIYCKTESKTLGLAIRKEITSQMQQSITGTEKGGAQTMFNMASVTVNILI